MKNPYTNRLFNHLYYAILFLKFGSFLFSFTLGPRPWTFNLSRSNMTSVPPQIQRDPYGRRVTVGQNLLTKERPMLVLTKERLAVGC